MKHLWKYLRAYKLEASVAPFLKLAEALLELCIPLFVGAVIDAGTGPDAGKTVTLNVLKMILFGIAGMLLSVSSQYLSARAAVGFSAAVRAEALKSALRSNPDDLGKLGQSALITRITSDVDRVQNGVNLGLRLLLRSPFIVFGAVAMAFFCDVRTALWFAAAVPVLAAVIFAFMFLGKPLQKRAAGKLEALTLRTRDSLSGVRVIRAFGVEGREEKSFVEENEEHFRASVSAGTLTSFLNPITLVIVNLTVIMIILTGVRGVDAGRISQGSVVSLYNYMALILTELVKLANLIVTLTKTAASADRIAAVIGFESEKLEDGAETGSEQAPAVEFDAVTFRYGGAGAPAVTDITLSVGRGENLGVIGGTGSGKSTFAALIPGLRLPESGHVRINGTDTSEGRLGDVRKAIAYVPQKARLFAGTVAENMRWGKPDATDEEIKTALETACALDFVMKKPEGLNAPVSKNGVNFSGGQRQRLSIARALIRKPDIIVLDDSFSALDMATDLKVRQNIASLDYKPCTVIISQRPSSVISCDRILVLDNGHKAGLGSHAELMETCALYREIYESQYGEESAK
ncbi:MAG: ABC transporter ATP-binding protein/permease [Clostridia bacterium]|nr:ABC transporter ATP-binding protein/permease [Clostridia bacterium]